MMIEKRKKKAVVLNTVQRQRDAWRHLLASKGFKAISFEKTTICMDNFLSLAPDIVVVGSLSFEKLYRFLTTMQMINSAMPMVVLSNDERIQNAVKLDNIKQVRILPVPFDQKTLLEAVQRVCTARVHAPVDRKRQLIIGNSVEIRRIKRIIKQLGNNGDSILIVGEKGTGKELVAKAIHYQSGSGLGSMIKISNGSEILNPTVQRFYDDPWRADDENNQIGPVTIFVDQVEKISPEAHRRLFRLIDGPVPASEMPKTKIVATCEPSLDALVNRNHFRKDLYHRLNVIRIDIPPLRKRKVDIPLLFNFFSDQLSIRTGNGFYSISDEHLKCLNACDWPGNLDQFKRFVRSYFESNFNDSVIKLAVGSEKLTSKYFESHNSRSLWIRENWNQIDLNGKSLNEFCRELSHKIEKTFINRALAITLGNRKKAADLLKISYKSFLNKAKIYRIEFPVKGIKI